MTPKTEIVPDQTEVVASQQATIERLIDFREAQGLEIEKLKAQLALRDTFRQGELEAMQKLTDQLADANAEVNRLTNCIEICESKNNELGAKCAEMRKLAEKVWNSSRQSGSLHYLVSSDGLLALVNRSTAPDCQDFVPRAELDKLREQVKPLVEAARMAADWFETGPADFQKAADEIVPMLEQALALAKELGLT